MRRLASLEVWSKNTVERVSLSWLKWSRVWKLKLISWMVIFFFVCWVSWWVNLCVFNRFRSLTLDKPDSQLSNRDTAKDDSKDAKLQTNTTKLIKQLKDKNLKDKLTCLNNLYDKLTSKCEEEIKTRTKTEIAIETQNDLNTARTSDQIIKPNLRSNKKKWFRREKLIQLIHKVTFPLYVCI